MPHVSATQAMPSLRPTRRGTLGLWFALVGLAIALAVVVALIVTWPDHGHGSAADTGTSSSAKRISMPPAPPAAPKAATAKR
jgi:hypothetical protein